MAITESNRIQTTRKKKGGSVWLTPDKLKEEKAKIDSKRPRISVIIPTSNQYRKVSTAYNSVYKQLEKLDCVIIADQGSEDGTNPTMFADNNKVIYTRFPKASRMEIINFVITNIVQTKYVLLLDTRSILEEGAISKLKSVIGNGDNHDLFICRNVATDPNKTKTLESYLSYSGYLFQKNDAIKAGLFNLKNEGVAPALFIDQMEKIGCKTNYRDNISVKTIYIDLKRVNIDTELVEKLNQKGVKSDYSHLNLNLDPVTFIVIGKQNIYLDKLITQLRLQEDEIQKIPAIGTASFNKKFGTLIKKAKHSKIIIARSNKNVPFNYDPITNLRLMPNDNILQTGMEEGVNLISFPKKTYMAPKSDLDLDATIKFISKKKNKPIERTDVIIHPKRIKTHTTVRSGFQIEETVRPEIDTLRKREGHTTVYERSKNTKRKKAVLKPAPKPPATKKSSPLYAMKWKDVKSLPKIHGIERRKPKILFICDVQGWAWHYKSMQLKKYLSDEFRIDVIWLLGPGAKKIRPRVYDLYFTFGYTYVDYIKSVAARKRITGITAHRPRSILMPQMRKAAAVHANSMMLYHELKTMHNIVYYVPNGVDEQLFKPIRPIPKERDNIIVGHVGKRSIMKGQDKYIIPAIKQAGAKAMFHFNDYTNALPIEQMPGIYQDMDVFIVASKEDGTPNPALEAAACGRPIISNRIGNMPEFIKDGWNGFLVDKDISAYVEKIKWLKRNRDKLIEMGQNARKTVEKEWTWEIQAERYRKMFREVLGLEKEDEKPRKKTRKRGGRI